MSSSRVTCDRQFVRESVAACVNRNHAPHVGENHYLTFGERRRKKLLDPRMAGSRLPIRLSVILIYQLVMTECRRGRRLVGIGELGVISCYQFIQTPLTSSGKRILKSNQLARYL